MTALLIADLHLDRQSPALLEMALAAFEDARQFDQLWILGDLFEAWIGDDIIEHDPVAAQVASALARTARSGTQVHLMHGNRDFLLGEQFAHAAGAALHREDELVVELDGNPVLLLHGDTLCTGDTDYQQMRSQVRDPVWQSELLGQDIETRLATARQLRAASRSAGHAKTLEIMDVDPGTVAARFDATGVTAMVHGHTHRPATHFYKPGTATTQARYRLVVGDWQPSGADVVLADAGGIRRLRYPFDVPLPSRESAPAPPL